MISTELVGRGGTLEQAFIQVALAAFALTVDPTAVRSRETRETRAHGPSPEALLVHWIRECCYVQEIEGFVCQRIDLAVFDVAAKVGGEPMRLHAFLQGEEIDPTRHRPGARIKAVSDQKVSIRSITEGYEIRLTVQI